MLVGRPILTDFRCSSCDHVTVITAIGLPLPIPLGIAELGQQPPVLRLRWRQIKVELQTRGWALALSADCEFGQVIRSLPGRLLVVILDAAIDVHHFR